MFYQRRGKPRRRIRRRQRMLDTSVPVTRAPELHPSSSQCCLEHNYEARPFVVVIDIPAMTDPDLHTVTAWPSLTPVLQKSPTFSPTQVRAMKSREPAPSSPRLASASSGMWRVMTSEQIPSQHSPIRLGLYSSRMRQ